MAKARFTQNSFTSGVLSPLLRGRTELAQYYQGLEIGRNWVIMPQGGIRRRPGTQFIDKALPILSRNATIPTMPEGGTSANINDDNDSTNATTTINISTINPYVVAKYDLGAETYIELADIRGVFLTSQTNSEFSIEWSNDDVSYFSASSTIEITPTSNNIRLRLERTARYFRFVRGSGATDLGADKVTLSEFNLYELSTTLSNVKLKDFSVETNKHFLLSLTEGNIRIYQQNTTTIIQNLFQADLKSPYTTAELKDVRDVQVENVMLLFHPNHPTKRLINVSGLDNWTIDDFPYLNIPQFDFDDSLSPSSISDVQVLTFVNAAKNWAVGDTFQLDLESVLTKSITFAGDTGSDQQDSTAANIQKNIQDSPTMGEFGVAVVRTAALTYTITITEDSTKDFELFSGFPITGNAGDKEINFTHTTTGVSRKEDVWGVNRGYPKTACFYEGRLVIGGTKSKPQSLLMSKSGQFTNFEIDDGADDEGIFITISSRKLSNITDVFPGRNLQIFADGSEFSINASPLTPSTVSVTPQTSHGSINLEAKDIDGATIFADRNGKTLRSYLYSFNEDAYVSTDISVLSSELIKQPVDISILGGTTSEDANWIFITNSDGSATILNTLRDQDINGFTEWTTSGFIDNASVVDEELYMVNKRTVGGLESNFIERWDFEHYVDNGLTLDNIAPLDSVPGFDHLEGETVKVSAIDPSNPLGVIVLPDRVVTNGNIDLTSPEEIYTKIQAGIGFTPTLKPMPVNTNVGSGQNAMRRKSIVRMNMRINNSSGLSVDGMPLPVRGFDQSVNSPLNSFPMITTGVIDDILGQLGWGLDEMPTFTVDDQTPCTILAIEYEVSSS